MTPGLIERLEAAGEGSRELDGAVWYAVHEPDVEHGCLHVEQTEQGPVEVLTCELGSKYADCVGAYTTSLDAALALAERVLPGWCISLQRVNGWRAALADSPISPDFYSDAATAPLALTAAILKAYATSKPKEGERG